MGLMLDRKVDNFNHKSSDDVFWESEDCRVQLIRHDDDLYEIVFEGETVMPPCSLEKMSRYYMHEFSVDTANDEFDGEWYV